MFFHNNHEEYTESPPQELTPEELDNIPCTSFLSLLFYIIM
jgi:hypothetical protein